MNIAAGGESGPVPIECTKQAVEWCDYLESHALRVYGLVLNFTERAATELARHISNGDVGEGFTARDIYRKQWKMLKDSSTVEGAIQELIKLNWLREKENIAVSAGRKPLPHYEINPSIKKR